MTKPKLAMNTLDWILRRIDRLEEDTGIRYKNETSISDILSKENSKYNDGDWIEAFYDSDGNLGRARGISISYVYIKICGKAHGFNRGMKADVKISCLAYLPYAIMSLSSEGPTRAGHRPA